MPKHCSHVLVNGRPAVICGPVKYSGCSKCGEIAGYLCDWKVGHGRTCDRPLCDDCRHTFRAFGKQVDLCDEHELAWRSHPANKQGVLEL